MKSCPTFNFEKKLWNEGKQFIAGLDEVGRGAFAGPVVAAAVILPQKLFPHCEEINDSKLLTAKKREELAEVIKQYAVSYAIAQIEVEVINLQGIGKATALAFMNAAKNLHKRPDHFLIDAFFINGFPQSMQTPIVKGDQKSFSIAAASIIAKVFRDNLMAKLGTQFSSYQFAKHKGYGTLEHRNAIKKFGLCPLHRTSFDLQKFL